MPNQPNNVYVPPDAFEGAEGDEVQAQITGIYHLSPKPWIEIQSIDGQPVESGEEVDPAADARGEMMNAMGEQEKPYPGM